MLLRARVRGGFRRTIDELENLNKAYATVQSRNKYFPKFHQDYGDVESMIIGPLRPFYIGSPLRTLRGDVEFPRPRLEKKKLRLVVEELQYHWEINSRLIESVTKLDVYESLKADIRRLLYAGDVFSGFCALPR